MREEHLIVSQWRNLFRGQAVTADTLVQAEALVERLGPESPLRVRFSGELKDLRKMQEARAVEAGGRPRRRR